MTTRSSLTPAPILLALLLAACDSPATTQHEQAARSAAEQWLARTDGGDHAGAWEMTTPVFRVSIRKEEWEATQTTLYRQLGVPKSRELIAAKYTNTPTRGLGEGEFVLIQYRRPVEWATPVLETLTMKRVGEQWKPTGYNIRPFE